MMLKFVFLAVVGLTIFFNQPCDGAMVPGLMPHVISEGITCSNVRCGANSKCSGCAPNDCNTYTCKNPTGANAICTTICEDPGAHCICDEGHHRDESTGECVPLICPGGPMIPINEPAVEPVPVSEPEVKSNPTPFNV